MHVKYVRQGNLEKAPQYEDIINAAGVSDLQVAYIGDDFTDVILMKRVGLACAVGDARQEVKSQAHFVTLSAGGCAMGK